MNDDINSSLYGGLFMPVTGLASRDEVYCLPGELTESTWVNNPSTVLADYENARDDFFEEGGEFERIVRETLKKVLEEGKVPAVKEIEKYHIKHR